MKKIMSVLLSMLLMASALPALAESIQVEPIVGKITEMREDGSFLVEELEGGNEVHVQVSEETKTEVEWSYGVGDVVIVSYNGRMTRSLPPQITAETIRSYTVYGLVVEANKESGRLLVNSPEVGDVFVNLPEDMDADAYANRYVRVYFNGVMAMSLPGQISALSIETLEMIEGEVRDIANDETDATKGWFMMDWGESGVMVKFSAGTKAMDSFNTGDTVQVYYNGIMTRSLPGQIFAMAIAKVSAGE